MVSSMTHFTRHVWYEDCLKMMESGENVYRMPLTCKLESNYVNHLQPCCFSALPQSPICCGFSSSNGFVMISDTSWLQWAYLILLMTIPLIMVSFFLTGDLEMQGALFLTGLQCHGQPRIGIYENNK